MQKYKPKEVDGQFIWQCAYTDAFARPYILPGYIWEMLYGWDRKDNSSLFKCYSSEEEAIKCLQRAVDFLRDGLKGFE